MQPNKNQKTLTAKAVNEIKMKYNYKPWIQKRKEKKSTDSTIQSIYIN